MLLTFLKSLLKLTPKEILQISKAKISQFNFRLSLGLLFNIIFKLMAIGLGIYTARWLNKYLTAQEYNVYVRITTSYSHFILLWVNWGIQNLIQKYYTNEKNPKKLASIWTTLNFLRVCSYFWAILTILLTYRIANVESIGIIILLFSGQFILLADENYRSVCNAKRRPWQFSLVDFLAKLILIFLLFLYPLFWQASINGLWYYGYIAIGSYTLGMIIDGVWQWKDTGLGPIDFRIIKEKISPIIFLAVSQICMASYNTTDKLFLAHIIDDKFVENGYADAYRLFEIAINVPSLTIPTLASIIKNQIDTKKISSFKLIQAFALISAFFGLVCYLGIIIVGPFLIRLIQQEKQYPVAFEALPIISISLIFIFPSILFTLLLIFINKEKFELISNLITAIITLSLYAILIPHFGFYGAAWATVISYVVKTVSSGVFTFTFLRKYLKKIDTKPYVETS